MEGYTCCISQNCEIEYLGLRKNVQNYKHKDLSEPSAENVLQRIFSKNIYVTILNTCCQNTLVYIP